MVLHKAPTCASCNSSRSWTIACWLPEKTWAKLRGMNLKREKQIFLPLISIDGQKDVIGAAWHEMINRDRCLLDTESQWQDSNGISRWIAMKYRRNGCSREFCDEWINIDFVKPQISHLIKGGKIQAGVQDTRVGLDSLEGAVENASCKIAINLQCSWYSACE